MSLSNQFLGLRCIPYRVFFRRNNLSGWMNGQPLGSLMAVVSLSGRVVLQKLFLQLPCLRRHYLVWSREAAGQFTRSDI